jgi:hypothetical protein
MGTDRWKGYPDSPIFQGRKLKQVTPDDNNDLPVVPKALYVTGAGNLSVLPVDGYEDAAGADAGALTKAVAVGDIFDMVLVKRVKATGTTATVVAII